MLSTIKPGTILDSRYELLELVGEGGMGSVFRVREQELDRLVAIKFLHEGLVGDSESQARIKREGSVLAFEGKLSVDHALEIALQLSSPMHAGSEP